MPFIPPLPSLFYASTARFQLCSFLLLLTFVERFVLVYKTRAKMIKTISTDIKRSRQRFRVVYVVQEAGLVIKRFRAKPLHPVNSRFCFS